MEQEQLWHDTPEEALEAVVNAIGGPKAVGAALWPMKTQEAARRRVNHCLDAEREEKFSLTELLWILNIGRQAGCHTGMHYFTNACSYEVPKPMEPEDEKAALQREIISTYKGLESLVKRMERLSGAQ